MCKTQIGFQVKKEALFLGAMNIMRGYYLKSVEKEKGKLV